MSDETAPPPADAWIDAVREVVDAARESDVAEIELVSGAFRVRVRRQTPATTAVVPRPVELHGEVDDHLHRVTAPLTGIFYRSASPAARPYVDEGDWVDADTVIGLIETMKIFNEVTADRSGRVIEVLADSGQLVHAGDALLTLEPGGRTAAEPERSV